MSTLLFNLAVHWIMRRTTEHQIRGKRAAPRSTDSRERNQGDGKDMGRHQAYGKESADLERARYCPTCHLCVKGMSECVKPSGRSITATKDFSARQSQNVVKHDASGKKGKLSCCKCRVDQIKANLADIQPENHQNAPKRVFGKKLQESMG